MTLAAPAWSQDATGDQIVRPATGQAQEVQAVPEAESGTGQPAASETGQATPETVDADPAATTAQPVELDSATGTGTSGQPITLPSGEQATTTVEATPEPAPSFLKDPAGAISHLLTQAERDPNLPHDLSPWGMFMMADWW